MITRSTVRPAIEREALRRHHRNAALTAALCVTALLAFVAGLLSALSLSWAWTAVALTYAVAAGFWGGYRAADAQPVQMPGSLP